METESIELLKDRLKRLREEKGFSQRTLGMPGATYAYICRIELGTRNPSVKALRLLAGKLGVDPVYLETGLGPVNYQKELEEKDNIIDRLLENEIFRNTFYRYTFGCGCCFDTTESLMNDLDSFPRCPIHKEVAYSTLRANYKCGCYFKAKGMAPSNCPIHDEEMTYWSLSAGWEQRGSILNADESTSKEKSPEGQEVF